MEKRGLVLLSFGAGQDSAALRALYLHDAAFREKYVGDNDFAIVMGDTGDEHEHTDIYREWIAKESSARGIPFFFLSLDQGYHAPSWRKGLRGKWEKDSTIGSAAYPKSCSPSLKTDAVYNWLPSYISERFGYENRGKRTLEQFAKERGKIKVWIGYARGEESRLPASAAAQTVFEFAEEESTIPVWQQKSIELVFPLIELGMNREDCQNYLRSVGEIVPKPSLCYSCPFKSKIEILWSARRYPERFARWVADERRKLDAWADEEYRRARQRPEKFVPNDKYKNAGVSGKGEFRDGRYVPVTLLDTLREAEVEFGHMSDEDLDDYVNSHGHCVKSKLAA